MKNKFIFENTIMSQVHTMSCLVIIYVFISFIIFRKKEKEKEDKHMKLFFAVVLAVVIVFSLVTSYDCCK